MERTAACACGQLSITFSGKPKMVIACHCSKCQRRTGSVLGVSAYFSDDLIAAQTGESRLFVKTGDSGKTTTRQFCPTCGSTVFWQADFLANHTGVAVGAFADPNFPEPAISAWEMSKHAWLTLPEQWPCSDTQEF